MTVLGVPPSRNRRVAVLGAGISGLATGHFLAGVDGLSVDILEAKPVVGGRANVEDGAEHCQRLFLSDYRMLLPLLDQIPFDHTGSVRDQLVRMRRFARTPTRGWVEISHQYSIFASEIGMLEKARIARASRESILLARRLRRDSNFLGGPKNKYSLSSKIAVARNFMRKQVSFAFPGGTDTYLTDPWVRHLESLGVTVRTSTGADRMTIGRDAVEIHAADTVQSYDAVVSTLFVSSLRALLDRSAIAHWLPSDDHAHCPCFTIDFDPEERSPKVAEPSLHSHDGSALVVQPEANRCVVLCFRGVRADAAWALSWARETLRLTHPVMAIRTRLNSDPDEALFIGDHIEEAKSCEDGDHRDFKRLVRGSITSIRWIPAKAPPGARTRRLWPFADRWGCPAGIP